MRAAMTRKYDALIALREAHARGDEAPAREVLRALAEEFPGALRELDALSLDALRARRDDAARDEPPPWVAWMHAYHRLMRATLWVKRAQRGRDVSDELAREASARADITLDADYLRAVRRPPHGRLGALVFQRLGAAYAVAPEAMWQVLFPHPRAAAPWRE